MKEFERIHVEKGEAYIRDTEITVSEIVSLYLTEKDMQSIFQRYSALETDDIFEALGYAVQNIRSIISVIGHDIRSPLGSIRGYAALLTELPQDTFTDEQRLDFIRTILKIVVQLENYFTDFLDWNRLHYSNHHEIWEKFSLDKAIEGTFQLIQSHWPDAVVNGQIPTDLPAVKSDNSLLGLFYKLFGDNLFGMLKREVTWREISFDERHVF